MKYHMLTSALLLVVSSALSANAQNLLRNGNFAKGNAGFITEYAYSNPACGPGSYTIATNAGTQGCSGWVSIGPRNGRGQMFLADGSTSSEVKIWEEKVLVSQDTDYVFTFWGTCVDDGSNGNQTSIQVYFNGRASGRPLVLPDGYDGRWHKLTVHWNSQTDTTAKISIVDTDTVYLGNDFALDDFKFSQNTGTFHWSIH